MGWRRTGHDVGAVDVRTRVDVAASVARRVQVLRPSGADALQAAVVTALRELDGAGAGRRVDALRSRRARQVVLLDALVVDGRRTALVEHVRLVLNAPAGDPLWQDLRRLTTLLDELEAVRRRQRLQVRLRRDVGAELRGTEQVIATAMQAFRQAWGGGRLPPD